jgi:hypothetical protein
MEHNGTPEKKKDRKPGWKRAFLESYSQTGVIATSAEVAGVGRTTVYRCKEEDPKFAEAMLRAEADSTDLLLREAVRRAREGWEEPVVYQGAMSGCWVDAEGNRVSDTTPGAKFVPLTVRKYSDTLLIFLIKGRRPEYRDKVGVEVSGKNGGAIQHDHLHRISTEQFQQLPLDERVRLYRQKVLPPQSN